MDRNQFLKYMSAGTLIACTGCSLVSCDSSDNPMPTGLDFTLDLTLPANAALQNVGGSLTKDGVIIANVTGSEFTAVSKACTHAGTTINYRSTQQDFLCPNHGSVFDKNGLVKNGPAGSALAKYNTELTGTNLRVFS